ncbi:MAG: FliH/SctL family protein [Bdellovibrionota bacterium]
MATTLPLDISPPAEDSSDTSEALGTKLISARKIIAAAEAKAATLLRQAEIAAAERKKSAEAEGYREGVERALSRLLTFDAMRAKVLPTLADLVLRATVELTEELLGDQLRIQPETIVARVKRILDLPHSLTDAKLVVHPQTAELMRALPSGELSNICVVSDASMGVDDARLITSHASFELSVRDHFALLKQHLVSSERMRLALETHLSQALR